MAEGTNGLPSGALARILAELGHLRQGLDRIEIRVNTRMDTVQGVLCHVQSDVLDIGARIRERDLIAHARVEEGPAPNCGPSNLETPRHTTATLTQSLQKNPRRQGAPLTDG
jgi:hypothetical protein